MPVTPQKTVLFLHIGTEKTGSTTLQVLGHENRALLEGHGVLYPVAPGEKNHTDLAVFTGGGDAVADLARDPDHISPQGAARFRAQFAEKLTDELNRSPAPAVWLSNEHLSSRIRKQEEIDRLAALLKPMFKRIVIIAYLRHQPDLYVSFLSTSVKSGGGLDRPPPTNADWHYYNYEIMLGKWAQAFGQDAILPRVYDSSTLVKGDVVEDFFATIGMPVPESLVRPPKLNRRLDNATIHFLELFNQFVRRREAEGSPIQVGDLVTALEDISTGAAFTVDPDILRRIDRIFTPSNDKVAQLYFKRPGPLFPPGKFRELPPGPPLTVTRAVGIAVDLWRYKQNQIDGIGG